MMSRVSVLFWLLPRRLRSSWALLAITSFGVLAAVTVMAVGAIYSRALAETGLRHALAAHDPGVLNAHVIAQNRPLGPADYQTLMETIDGIISNRLGYLTRDIQRFGRVQPNLSLVESEEARTPDPGSPLGRPFFLTGFESHSRIVEGSWPQSPPKVLDQGLELDAVAGRRAASTMGWKVGSRLHIVPFRGDPAERITVNLVGLAEPVDPNEEYWMGSLVYFNTQDFNGRILVNFYLPEDSFFSGLGSSYPSLVADYGWFLYLDTDIITAGAVQSTEEAILGLETDINSRFPRTLVLTLLRNSNDTGALATYRRDLALARAPIFLFISLVVVVILYFISLVVGLMARARSDESSLLRSRGAGILQVSGLLVLGEGLIALVAAAVGPFLALLLFHWLLFGTMNPAGGESRAVSVGLSADMFIMGAVGGVLALLALIASGVNLARIGVLEFLRARARPPTVSVLHRYYVDLLALAAGGIVWWQIQGREGFASRALAGRNLEVDLTLLLGPVLVLVATAFLLLRVLPVLVRGLAWAGNALAPAWMSFSLSRISRDPLPHGALAVMLMMAAALGVFGASFQSTLSRSEREQVLYDLGGSLVLQGGGLDPASIDKLAGVPGVLAASPIARLSATLLDGLPNTRSSIIGLDPGAVDDVAWFREDFSPGGKTLAQLMAPLRGRFGPNTIANQGIPVPDTATSIGIWTNLDGLDSDTLRQAPSLWARVSDARGRYRTLHLGDLHTTPAGQSWTFFAAPLPDRTSIYSPPFHLVSIYLSGSVTSRIPPGSIGFDDITALGENLDPAAGAVIEGFEEDGDWVAILHAEDLADTIARTPRTAHTGQSGLSFSWEEPLSGGLRGIIIPPGPFPMPAVGGPAFHSGQRIRVQAGNHVIPVVIQDVVDFFPSVDPGPRPFMLMAFDDYDRYIERLSGGAGASFDEIWVALEEGVDRELAAQSIREALPGFTAIRDRTARVILAERNPLAGGGWNGLTLLSVFTLTGAVLVALITHAIIAVRDGRVDLTVARVMGFSRFQIFLSLALEKVVVAIAGIVTGSLVGLFLGWWVLGLLDRTPGGRPVIPPMIFTVQEWLVVLVLFNLVIAALLAIVFATVAAGRLRAAEILRTGG